MVLMGLYLDTNVKSADSGQHQQPGPPPRVRTHHEWPPPLQESAKLTSLMKLYYYTLLYWVGEGSG